ncbi:hypothetical protein B0H13DRAFT_2323840 [Mycena leptocephala]|nr:hypothetical protein B0H13DRAFT_2323840 [Mycena leptocephala]
MSYNPESTVPSSLPPLPDVAPPSSHSSDPNSDSPEDTAAADASAHITALLPSQPRTLPAVRAHYMLKTSRPAPIGFDALFTFAQERGCLVDGYAGVWRDFAPFGGWRWALRRKGRRRRRVGEGGEEGREGMLASDLDTHGIPALAIREGGAHKPEHQATYFDGDWEGTVNKVRVSSRFSRGI